MTLPERPPAPRGRSPIRPGEVVLAREHHDPLAAERRTLLVRSASPRVIRVASHYPFWLVNRRLIFDRDAALGFRLDLPAGATARWAPGEEREVRLVRRGPVR